MKSTFRKTYARLAALLAVGIIATIGPAHADGWRDDDELLAQMTELEQLHATFHACSQRARSRERRFGCSDNSANPRGAVHLGSRRGTHDSRHQLPRQEIISAMAIRRIPQPALHPRATILPPGNRARCARSSSMFPAGCSQPISLCRLPRRSRPSMSL